MNRIIPFAVAALLAGPVFAQAPKDALNEPAPHTLDLRKYVD